MLEKKGWRAALITSPFYSYRGNICAVSESFSSGAWDSVRKDVNGWTAHPAEWERRQHPCLPQMEVCMLHSKQCFMVWCLKFRKPVSRELDYYTKRSERTGHTMLAVGAVWEAPGWIKVLRKKHGQSHYFQKKDLER